MLIDDCQKEKYYQHRYLYKKARIEKLKASDFKCELCGSHATLTHHKDGLKHDHSQINLMALCEVCHRNCHKLIGDFHPRKILSGNQILEIRHLRDHGMSVKDLAKQFNVSISHISRICSGERWSHLEKCSVIRKVKLTNMDIEEIRLLQKYGFSISDLAFRFNVSRQMISSILNGKTWVYI